MILLTVDEIINLQETLIDKTGGESGLRDRGLLESAVYSAVQIFGDVEVYQAVPEKAARLAYAITKNHAFVDGNKRVGIFVMLMALKLNSVNIDYTQQELINLGLGIADSSLLYEDILSWINKHLS